MEAASSALKDPGSGADVENPLVFFHGRCPDGFLAALCAWLYFGGKGEYVPREHDQPLPDVSGRDVYMLDIAFEPEVMEHVSRQARRLVVLDHHKSAADKLANFKCTCGLVRFDLTKSAARLSWEYFNPGVEPPALVRHVEDRDLLKWELEDSAAYLLALDAGPYNFHRWAGVLRMPEDAYERFMDKGRAMLQQFKKLARGMAEQAVPVSIAGFDGLLANAPYVFHSEVGQLLVERGGTYAAMWCLEPCEGGQRVRVGLRAGDAVDVIQIAAVFGGGGHPNASAFRLPLARLLELLSGRLDARS